MYIEKRWLVPAALTLVLFGALFAIALLLVKVGPAEIASSNAPELVSRQTPICDPPPTVTHVAETAPVQVAPTAPIVPAAQTVPSAAAPVPAVGSPGTPQAEEVVDIETVDSNATQITTRGFGDVGMQFQDVQINAPITIVHVSNEGNNNATNANIGEENRVVSEQEQLQSNRSDGSLPVTTAPATGATPGPADVQPTAAPATGTASNAATPPTPAAAATVP